MSSVVAIRNKLKPEFQKSYGVNPTYLVFVARAVVETLRDYPWINGEIRGDKIVTRNFVNLGFAVELADGKGLIVPVVKHAEGLNLLGMARGVADIAERARNKQLSPDEVQGGTFTITNPGGYGTFHGTPVISQPQAGDPRHLRGREAAVGRPGRARQGRDRDPADHEPDAHVRPPARRRRARRTVPARPAAEARELGRIGLLMAASSGRPDGGLRGRGGGDRLAGAGVRLRGESLTSGTPRRTEPSATRNSTLEGADDLSSRSRLRTTRARERQREDVRRRGALVDNPWVVDGQFVEVGDVDGAPRSAPKRPARR